MHEQNSKKQKNWKRAAERAAKNGGNGRANQYSPTPQAIMPISASIAYIPLTRDLFALVDSDDADLLSMRRWHAHRNSTTRAYYALGRTDQMKHIGMHRYLLNADSHVEVDHANRNTLDNRRSNIRIATRSQNQANRTSRNKLGYKGISRSGKRYAASISVQKKQVYLGSFMTPEQAHLAYVEAAKTYYGEFACTI